VAASQVRLIEGQILIRQLVPTGALIPGSPGGARLTSVLARTFSSDNALARQGHDHNSSVPAGNGAIRQTDGARDG
jgi:hypothetical protein